MVVSKIYGVNKIPNNHHKYVGWRFSGVHDFDNWGVDNFDDLWTFMISWNGCHNYQPTTCQNLTHPVWGVENLNHPSQWMLFPTNIGCLDIPQHLSWPLFQQNRGSSSPCNVDGYEILHQFKVVVYPSIYYRVSTIQSDAGFLPSAVNQESVKIGHIPNCKHAWIIDVQCSQIHSIENLGEHLSTILNFRLSDFYYKFMKFYFVSYYLMTLC